MIAANFRKHPEAKAAQLCFDFYLAFEMLCQVPSKIQQQAIALGEWAKKKATKKDVKPAESKKPHIAARIWKWIKRLLNKN